MTFIEIKQDTWKRKPYFDSYMESQTSFSMTVPIDITVLLARLKKQNYKLYPALLFMVTKVINQHSEFRTTFNLEGILGTWDEMHPAFTVFNQETKLFSERWLENHDKFSLFHQNYLADQKAFLNETSQTNILTPENVFPVSMIHWQSFTGFNLNINNNKSFLLPITTFGKYYSEGERVMLPVSLQVHHAVCDGYHASLFIEELTQLAAEARTWLD